mgnify:CR=1 FL=1
MGFMRPGRPPKVLTDIETGDFLVQVRGTKFTFRKTTTGRLAPVGPGARGLTAHPDFEYARTVVLNNAATDLAA